MRRHIEDFLGSAHRSRTRLAQALVVGAALAGVAGWLVAAAASASGTAIHAAPSTSPITDPLPPGSASPSATSASPSTNPITDPLPPAPPGTPRCLRAQLRMKFVDMQGATGHRFIDYKLTNVGASSCSLRGYPGAVLLKKNGAVKHAPAAKVGQDPVSPVKTIVVDPGKHAFFTFTWVAGGFCPGDNFAFYAVRLFPPNDVNGFKRHFGWTPACASSVQVFAVRRTLKGL